MADDKPPSGVSREPRPLGSYAVLAGVFQALTLAGVVWLRRAGKRLPDRPEAGDVVLVGAATYKLTRLLAKDRVTSFVRAPFTEYQGRDGPGEVDERPRGSGLRRAVGELVVCPYCLGVWVATAFALAFVAAPRATRLVAFTLSALGVSDFLQIAHRAAQDRRSR